jgi:hypothetical protein
MTGTRSDRSFELPSITRESLDTRDGGQVEGGGGGGRRKSASIAHTCASPERVTERTRFKADDAELDIDKTCQPQTTEGHFWGHNSTHVRDVSMDVVTTERIHAHQKPLLNGRRTTKSKWSCQCTCPFKDEKRFAVHTLLSTVHTIVDVCIRDWVKTLDTGRWR